MPNTTTAPAAAPVGAIARRTRRHRYGESGQQQQSPDGEHRPIEASERVVEPDEHVEAGMRNEQHAQKQGSENKPVEQKVADVQSDAGPGIRREEAELRGEKVAVGAELAQF